jgi:hypothetical protein
VGLRGWVGQSKKVSKITAFFGPGVVNAAAKPTLGWCGKGLHLAAAPKDEETKDANGSPNPPKPDDQ